MTATAATRAMAMSQGVARARRFPALKMWIAAEGMDLFTDVCAQETETGYMELHTGEANGWGRGCVYGGRETVNLKRTAAERESGKRREPAGEPTYGRIRHQIGR